MSEGLGDRLRRLRREEAPRAAAEPSQGLPAWFLARKERVQPAAPPHEDRLAAGLPTALEPESNARGEFASRRAVWTREHVHGSTPLASALELCGDSASLLAHDPALRGLEISRALFLDIETTGLAGGAGTKAFLVGLGSFGASGFELWQGFLRGPEEEAALLSECAERIRNAGAIVTFFGKSFDRHRLEDKMRMHGIAPPFERCLHLDLYHPCRRLFGGRFEDGRLATMERELAGLRRERDLPGAFAPAAWYDFLAGRAHLLEEVFRHNRDDILSLAALCGALGKLVQGEGAADACVSSALARSAGKLGRWSEAAEWAARAERRAEGGTEVQEFQFLRWRALRRSAATFDELALLQQIAAGPNAELSTRAAKELARFAKRGRARAAGSAPSESESAQGGAPAR